MRLICSWRLRFVVSACLVFSWMAVSIGQDKAPGTVATGQPSIIVSTSKIEQLLASVSYLMRSVNQPEIGGTVTMTVNMFSRGLDRTRPIGFVVSLNAAGNPVPVLLLPVSDVKAFFAGLQNLGEPEDLGDGLYTMDVGLNTVFAKELDKWLLVGQQEEAVKELKQVPVDMLQNLATRYDVGVKLDVQSIPPQMRDLWLGLMKDSYERANAGQKAKIQRELDKQEAAASTAEEKLVVAGRRAGIETSEQIQAAQIEQIEELIKSTKQIVLGLSSDSSNKQLYVEAASEFVAGSKLDAQAARSATAKTKYSGIQSDGQAISIAFTDLIDPSQIPQFEQWVNAAFDAFTQNADQAASEPGLTEFVKEIKLIVVKSIQDGIVDGSASITFKDGLNIVTAAHVSDGKQLAAALQKAHGLTKKGPSAPQVKFNAYTHQGVAIHVGSVKLPSDADEVAKKIFSETASFAIGTGDKDVYVAIGSQAEANLKAALDRAKNTASAKGTPMELKVDMGPLLEYIQSIEASPIVDAMIQAVQNYSRNDMLMVKSEVIPHGGLVRITIEEGILRAIGAALKAGQGNRPGGF